MGKIMLLSSAACPHYLVAHTKPLGHQTWARDIQFQFLPSPSSFGRLLHFCDPHGKHLTVDTNLCISITWIHDILTTSKKNWNIIYVSSCYKFLLYVQRAWGVYFCPDNMFFKTWAAKEDLCSQWERVSEISLQQQHFAFWVTGILTGPLLLFAEADDHTIWHRNDCLC